MTLGERICALRTAGGLSQSELAERLGVSRQSVSKWETDASMPDLDKLVKISEVFEVTLDQLVRGAEPAPAQAGEQAPAPPAVSERGRLTVRILAGLLLLLFGGLVLLLCTLAWGPAQESLILALPFLLCGAVCLVCRRHPALICGWLVWGLLAAGLPYATGIHIWLPLALVAMIRHGLWVQVFLAGWMYLFLAVLAAATFRQVRKWRQRKSKG